MLPSITTAGILKNKGRTRPVDTVYYGEINGRHHCKWDGNDSESTPLQENDVTIETTDHALETAKWRLRLEDLPPEIRAGIRALYAVRPWANSVVVLYPALWIFSIVLMEKWQLFPVRIAGILAIAVSIQAMGTLMHEALHGNLFRSPRFDRWVGFLLAIPTLFSASAYRVAHLNHHRYTRTERDQDEFSFACSSRRQYVAIFYMSFLIGSLLYMILVPWKAYAMASRTNRRRILTEYFLMFLAYAAAAAWVTISGHPEWLLWYWLVPFLIAVLLANVRALAEHMGTAGTGDAITRTRTVTSNRVVSFLMLNLNYHLEHHLFPAVPWYNLPRIHELLKPLYEFRGAEVRQSYAAFVFRCLRRCPEPVETISIKG